ncbi:hypothetical protein ACFOKF_04980 [Sphingobium rhizovicinum]|jgi:hypothetical protein|uniref:Uncharacterized protein n=1 Tax=Sphingobium rhizovicinum TaxID=432308 RepID=A0ABV7NDI5_9SPHN
MRFSGLMLLALIATAIAPHAAMATPGGMQAGFCGPPPPGWTPPGKRREPGRGEPDAACHLMACDRRKADRKARVPA